MSRRGWITIWRSALAALFSLFALAVFAADDVRFEHGRLAIETTDGRKVAFSVELAVSDEQRMRGLMHRQSMPQDHGMWFDFGASRMVTMWMRNTVLPLDMLFIDERGEVKHIRERAVPFSEEMISSGRPVRYVLELNAGTVDRLAIATGSRVDLESIEKSD